MEEKGVRCVAKTMDLWSKRKIDRTDGEGVQWAFCSVLLDVDTSLWSIFRNILRSFVGSQI